MSTILALSTGFLFLLKKPKVAETNYLRERTDSIVISALPHHQRPSNQGGINNTLMGDDFNQTVDSLLDRTQQQEEQVPLGIKEVAKSMWSLFWKPRFLLLAPQCAWTGVSIAFFSGNLVEMMVSTFPEDQKGSNGALGSASYAMIMFGVGEILGCFFIGWIVDHFGSYKATKANVLIMLVMGIFTVLFAAINKFNVLAFIMCFLWGFQDSAVNTHTQEILGFEFENNSEPFSVFNICQCIAMAIFSIIQISVDTQVEYIIFAIFVSILGMVACGNTLRFQFRE